LLLLAIVLAGGVGAQPANYPDKPVRIISDAAPGGAIDTNLRIIAESLSKKWAQQVVIENRPGAGGAISATAAAAAPPDGYTIYAFVDLNGKDGSLWDVARLVWFGVRHPTLFEAVGAPEGRTHYNSRAKTITKLTLHPNISTLAARFSNYLPVGENDYGKGSNTNAVRHAIWQGLIIRDFSAEDAELVGDVHETNPTRDLSMRHFVNLNANGQIDNMGTAEQWGLMILGLADDTTDLLNNERARSFYNEHSIRDKSNKGIVEYYLGIFQGTYVTAQARADAVDA
jgi:hypothetical protein